jgi:hypothetical protein
LLLFFIKTFIFFQNITLKKLKENQEDIYSRNQIRFEVEVMGTFRLILKSKLILDLKNFFYVPPFSKNWILVSKFCGVGYGFLLDENVFSILKTKVST